MWPTRGALEGHAAHFITKNSSEPAVFDAFDVSRVATMIKAVSKNTAPTPGHYEAGSETTRRLAWMSEFLKSRGCASEDSFDQAWRCCRVKFVLVADVRSFEVKKHQQGADMKAEDTLSNSKLRGYRAIQANCDLADMLADQQLGCDVNALVEFHAQVTYADPKDRPGRARIQQDLRIRKRQFLVGFRASARCWDRARAAGIGD